MIAFQPIESNSPLHSCSLLHGNSKRYPDLSFPPPSYFTLVARLPFFLFPPPSLLSTPRTRRSPLSYTGFAFYPWNNNASSNPRKRDLLLLGIDASACVRRILDFEAGRASLLVPSLFARLSLSLSLSYIFFTEQPRPSIAETMVYRLLTVDFAQRREKEKNLMKPRDGGVDIDVDTNVTARVR